MLKKLLPPLIAGLSAFLLIYTVSTYTNLFIGMERALLNGFYFVREPGIGEANPFVSPRVKLLGYDEDAIAVIGKWPWKRYVHAEFLRKIEKFSPETVFFDIIFAKPESVPPYIRKKLHPAPETLRRVEAAFAEMDGEFARALADHPNVYIDLQLIEEPRTSLPEAFKQRIRLTEQVISKTAPPAENVQSPVVFYSLEPILDSYVTRAHPVVVNALPDDDGVIRMFPLFYSYRMSDGSYRNIFTVVLALLQRYYHVDMSRVTILPDRVVLRDARDPVLDPETGRPTLFSRNLSTLTGEILNPAPPAHYAYNRNLYRFMVYRMRRNAGGSGKIPYFPLHVLFRGDNRLEIIDGWEVLDAARQAGADAVHLVVYRKKDVEIDMPVTGFFNINYAGREKIFYTDPATGGVRAHTPIPTESYRAVYTLDEPPDIPELDEAGRIKPGPGKADLSRWFYHYCQHRSDAIYRRAKQELGGLVRDVRQVRKYMNRHPEDGRFYHYMSFFKAVHAAPEKIADYFDRYPDFAEQVGQSKAYTLSEAQMTATLLNVYQDGFDRYYNRFIFTGGNATGLGDIQQTPYASMFGVNVIINAFNTIVTKNPLKMSVDIPRFDALLLAGLCLLCSLLYGFTGVRVSGILFAVTLLGTLVASTGMFYAASVFITTTPLVFANALIFVGIMVFKLLTEEREKKFIQDTFGAYLAPELIQEMHRTRTMPKLGGEAKVITAFFTDIQGFSTFSEKLTAHQLVELLNEYLSAMTDILIADRGTLDKYEGDAIIAFFGAPMELVDQEVRACRVAVNMQKKLAELRDKWRNEKVPAGEPNPNVRDVPPDQWAPGDRWPRVVHEMRMRIGINTGEIVVGNMGSTMRMNYTMMGDAVNLSARLEAAAKQYGVYTLVSEYTLDVEFIDEDGEQKKVMDLVETRFIDRITVVGRTEPVRVYELFAMKGGLSDQEKELISVFEAGMGHYLNMEWDKAIEKFSESYRLERFPFEHTTPSEVFIYRCREFKKNPPVASGRKWDGVFRLTKK